MTDGLRKSHLKKAHQVGLPEVGLPEGIRHRFTKLFRKIEFFSNDGFPKAKTNIC